MEQLKRASIRLKQPLFYLGIGGLAVVVDVGLFFILHSLLRWPVELALPIGFSCGLLTSFVLNKIVVFNTHEHAHSTAKQAMLYGVLVVFNLSFQYIFITTMARFNIDASISKIIATLITAAWNFFLYRSIIFK